MNTQKKKWPASVFSTPCFEEQRVFFCQHNPLHLLYLAPFLFDSSPFHPIIEWIELQKYWLDAVLCFQTASGVSSKVMDDYCWIHSSFHVRSEFQGNVGCILDTVLAGKDSIASAAADTPDTAFYQWVPFTLVFQASVHDRMIFLNINGNCLARCLARSMLKLTIIICLSCRPSCFTSRGSAGSLLKED